MSATRKNLPWKISAVTYRYGGVSVDPFTIIFRGVGEVGTMMTVRIGDTTRKYQLPVDEMYLPLFPRMRMIIFE